MMSGLQCFAQRLHDRWWIAVRTPERLGDDLIDQAEGLQTVCGNAEALRRIRRTLAAGETGRDDGASLDLGVGGAGRTGSLKCLHAHAGFALARPGYELGARIVAELEPLWPLDRCCSEE